MRRFFRNDIEPYYRDWEKQRTFPADTFRKAAASMGYANNSPISSFWTNARVHRILLGTSEIHRVLIGKSLS